MTTRVRVENIGHQAIRIVAGQQGETVLQPGEASDLTIYGGAIPTIYEAPELTTPSEPV